MQHENELVIETRNLETRLREKEREWQPHIPEPDHTDPGCAGFHALHALLCNFWQNNFVCNRHSDDYRIRLLPSGSTKVALMG